MSVKPYFRPKTTYNIKLDKLKAIAKLDKLEVTAKPNKLEVPAELDKSETLLFTLKVPQEPTKPVKPVIKRGRGYP